MYCHTWICAVGSVCGSVFSQCFNVYSDVSGGQDSDSAFISEFLYVDRFAETCMRFGVYQRMDPALHCQFSDGRNYDMGQAVHG